MGTLGIVLIVIFFTCAAMLWNEGMWSNALSLINVILAASLASNYYEPVAELMDGFWPSFTYCSDFVALWLVFALGFTLLRAFTDAISTVRVRFKMPVEHTGRVVFAAAVGWVMICFFSMSLHLAPLARTSFRGSFAPTPMANHFLALAPDRMWLAFIQSRSRGALSVADEGAESPEPADAGKRVFDPQGEFILKYGARRKQLESETGFLAK